MSGITLVVEDKGWRKRRGIQSRLKQAAQVAARATRLKGEVTLLLAGDTRLRALNRAFRGRDKATNVLSFPGDEGGDIAIALGVTAREAKAQGKPFADHAIHLAVHGVLHLLGHGHANERGAAKMETIERRVLAGFGIPDPY